MCIACRLSDPVNSVGATYSVVVGAGGRKKFLLSQIGFKKLDVIRRKVLRKFGWLLAQLVYHRESSGGGCWPMIIWLPELSCPRRSYLGLYLVHAQENEIFEKPLHWI